MSTHITVPLSFTLPAEFVLYGNVDLHLQLMLLDACCSVGCWANENTARVFEVNYIVPYLTEYATHVT